ncbi:spore germination protein [Cohnella terricola]|uniref:Spore germination protein n=1 Tax=Cohnella terricola TaxID=1289167 RepID=A0A559JQ91_9BACL|nr:spore germination protein [Cohnella terricola]TVY02027.1 spore germination protein [Cohnella terricola]
MNASAEASLFAELDDQLSRGRWNEELLRKTMSVYADIVFPSIQQTELADKLVAFYCEGMVDRMQLNTYFASICHYMTAIANHPDIASEYSEKLPLYSSKSTTAELISEVFGGSLILYRFGSSDFWVVQISDVPERSVEESNTEISIKGPKDAFTENVYTNLSLIRKRLPTGLLHSEKYVVGSLSQTRVVLAYLSHKANPDMLAQVRERLSTMKTECVVSSGQLEQWLSDRTLSVFPIIDYIGRPDFIVEILLRGRFAIFVDGSPMALIGPANFTELIKTPEDSHFPYYYVIFQRALRILGLALSILLPGFWMSIATVNLDEIPFNLLATVIISREGVPLPTILESLLMLFLFELLREAGIRLPKAVGQTIGIVGGIIIGDALIRAGLASPTLLVIIAISAVASFTLVNQSLSGSVSLLRLFIMLASACLGIYGFILALLAILVYLCRLESFGMAYLDPIVSLKFKEWLSALAMNPFHRKRKSSRMVNKR